jgi:formyltetrahydrofolate deformylase
MFETVGNILSFEQYVESDTFFMRVECSIDSGNSPETITQEFDIVASEFGARYEIRLGEHRPRVAIFVSKHLHCLLDLLWRHQIDELPCQISCIVSNHPDAKTIAENFGIEYHYMPMTPATKAQVESQQIALLQQNNIELVIMARYMQILSGDFIDACENNNTKIINIHHSFLPAFAGGNPYQQAFDRGVKVIGATSHYATADLDEGPIIEQDIIKISHKDSPDTLKSKGRDLEKVVLARAVRAHLESRVLVFGRKTVVFEG